MGTDDCTPTSKKLKIMVNLDINIDKPKHETRIVVAMSGGVDSSVAAALLVEAGYDVVGMTMQLYDHGEVISSKTCCAGLDIYDAKRVADKLDFPHYVLDYQSRFKQSVIEDFADTYIKGETPIPCVRCNQTVKFVDMFGMAKDLGADALATGHYVRRFENNGQPELHRGVDQSRDQSYFLFATTKEQLEFLRFPVGGMEKTETREHARRFDLAVSDKPDSQDICFVPDGNYSRIVEKLRPGALDPGDIVHIKDGSVLGQHKGIIHFTIGQRRGLHLSANNSGEPLYVVKIDPKTHQVFVGPKEALATNIIAVREVNWLGPTLQPNQPIELDVKIRSTQTQIPASLVMNETGQAFVHLKNPEYGIAGGQACVFYEKDRVLGGGWIQSQG